MRFTHEGCCMRMRGECVWSRLMEERTIYRLKELHCVTVGSDWLSSLYPLMLPSTAITAEGILE